MGNESTKTASLVNGTRTCLSTKLVLTWTDGSSPKIKLKTPCEKKLLLSATSLNQTENVTTASVLAKPQPAHKVHPVQTVKMVPQVNQVDKVLTVQTVKMVPTVLMAQMEPTVVMVPTVIQVPWVLQVSKVHKVQLVVKDPAKA